MKNMASDSDESKTQVHLQMWKKKQTRQNRHVQYAARRRQHKCAAALSGMHGSLFPTRNSKIKKVIATFEFHNLDFVSCKSEGKKEIIRIARKKVSKLWDAKKKKKEQTFKFRILPSFLSLSNSLSQFWIYVLQFSFFVSTMEQKIKKFELKCCNSYFLRTVRKKSQNFEIKIRNYLFFIYPVRNMLP